MKISVAKTILAAAAAMLAIFSGLGIQSYASPDNDLLRRIDAVFADWDRTTTPGMSLAVVRDGKFLHVRGYGLASLEGGVLNGPETVFDIGSISKQFTAAAVRILEYQKRLDLDDDIRTYLPEMPKYVKPITIRQLIHHTSGLRDYETLQWLAGELTDQGWHTNKDLLDLIARQKGLNFPPGERFQYTNSGYTLLAVIVERITGGSLGAFVRDHIFVPLGMSRSFILEDNRIVVKNRARGYSLRDSGFALDETLNESTGDGAVQTTVLDFARWDQNFENNRLEMPDFLSRMEEPGRLSDGQFAAMPGGGGGPGVYASGLVLGTYRGLKTVGHGGAYVGFRAGYLRFPEKGVSVILMANVADINPMAYCERVADVVLEKDFREPPAPAPPAKADQAAATAPATASDARLDVYAGEYFSEELPASYVLSVREESLRFVHDSPPSSAPLRRDGGDLFSFGQVQIRFQRGRGGKILGFKIESAQAKGLSFRKVR